MVSREERKDLLLETGVALSSELSLPVVLQRIVDLAVQLTGARYGALGVLGSDQRIQQFVTTGMDEETRRRIGHYPTGRGVLGALIEDATPLRLADISRDPRSVGFPAHHPPMKSFLGAPVKAMGRVFGNIYLTEKQGSTEFTQEDEEDLLVLATQAGISVANAYLYEETKRRERWLDAVNEIAVGTLAGDDVDLVLQLAASRARELVDGELATIAVRARGSDRFVNQAADGAYAAELLGQTFPVEGSISGEVIARQEGMIVEDASADPRITQPIVQMGNVGPAVVVPLTVRGAAFGTLTVANRTGGRPFGPADVDVVSSFALQAAVALDYGQTRSDLDRLIVLEDRERIAKELHDGAIQALFAVGMGLQGTAMMAADQQLAERIEGAVGELDRVIRDLRNYIFGLRPGILADRQLDQALKELTEDFGSRTGVVAVLTVDQHVAAELASRAGDLVQFTREALSNVGRHAGAATCRVSLVQIGDAAVLEIDDDGRGFDPAAARGSGNGLINLEERAAALGGTMTIDSVPGEGARLRVTIPLP
jgi:signal transduction histidine kinase